MSGRLAVRAAVLVVIAVLSGLIAVPVSAAADPPPFPESLPGIDPAGEPPPTDAWLVYEFASPDEGLKDLPDPPDSETSPTEAVEFDDYLFALGDKHNYTRGTRAHFYASYRDKIRRDPQTRFRTYLKRYILAVNNKNGGDAFSAAVNSKYGFSQAAGWLINQRIPGHDSTRQVDAYHPTDPDWRVIFEQKAGPHLVRNQLNDLAAAAIQENARLVYLFGTPPSTRSKNDIAAMNRATGYELVRARYEPSIPIKLPIPEDPHAPNAPPSARPKPGSGTGPMAAGGQFTGGAFAEAVENSPLSAEEAAEIDKIDQELAEEFEDRDYGTSCRDAPGTASVRALASTAARAACTFEPNRLGGVDFSTLELRYVSDTYRGQGAQFAFKVDAVPDDQPAYGGERAARLASDSFFVWLALPPSAFTVNLNPDEPDRIIEDRFGQTDAGRVLLEADLQMKKTTAALIHPETPLGRRFWDRLRGEDKCVSMRQWIVPAVAAVHETDNELFILDAPLDVKMETDYVESVGVGGTPGGACADRTAEEFNENLYREMILPEVVKAVNEAPEYADLRRVYYSRVAAQWFLERQATKRTAYSDIIRSGDISRWVSREPWSPREVFDRYVDSYTKGEFTYTYETVEGDYIYTYSYIFGGVDFTRVPEDDVGAEEFAATRPTLAQSVLDSLYTPTDEDGDLVWLGGLTTTRPLRELPALNPPAAPTSSPLFYVATGAPLLAWLIAGAWLYALWLRRRTRVGTAPTLTPAGSSAHPDQSDRREAAS